MLYLFTKKGRESRKAAKDLYQSVLRQARQPDLYRIYDVEDTLEGRFEMTALFGGLLMSRLCRPEMGRDGQIIAQAFFDVMFQNMEWGIREYGVGDLAVPRRIKKMMSDFKGRAYAYDEARNLGTGAMAHALARNVFNKNRKISLEKLEELANYVTACSRIINEMSIEDMWSAKISFPALPTTSYTDSWGSMNAVKVA